jgi:hypothetical protein
MKAFVPLNDNNLDGLSATEALVPYRPGLPLVSQFGSGRTWSEDVFNPDEVRARRRDAGPVQQPCPR